MSPDPNEIVFEETFDGTYFLAPNRTEGANQFIEAAGGGSYQLSFIDPIVGAPKLPSKEVFSVSLKALNQYEESLFSNFNNLVGWLYYHDLFGYSLGYTPYIGTDVCMGNFFFRELSSVGNPQDCPATVYVRQGISNSTTVDFLSWYPPLQNGVPLGIMFLTSIWFSGFLYVFLLGFSILRIGKTVVIQKTPFVRYYFSKAPFSIGGLIFGFLIAGAFAVA